MMKYLKIFTAGFLISLLGSIPIGTLNVSIVGLILKSQFGDAIAFGMGAIIVEMLLVWIGITILGKLEKLKAILIILNILMCTVLFTLATLSFISAFKMKELKDVIPFSSNYPFWAGMLLSFLNPLHLPFWMGWTSVLRDKKLLIETSLGYKIYVLSTGLGTSISFVFYGLTGNLFIDFFKKNQYIVNWVIGFTLLFTALIQSYKLLKPLLLLRKSAPPNLT
ncbi:LysE family transporter [Pedobacter aquatilis]|uniref:LysE family transporter n=1 Tax=Pedobacter aquatilis TaxID=351343 RepID=UPI0025B5715C|nr:LysE family transporter [Pedobacter aquatilis]MDN3585972.1 LysE family transporter [Pedobacter aquatilis]